MGDNTELKEEVSSKEEKGIAMEILGELKRQNERLEGFNKRLIAILIFVIFLWFSTIGGFVWYLSQYDFTGSIEQTGFYTFSDSNGNVISSDIDDQQMKDILEIINGKYKSNEKQNQEK